MTQQCFNTIAGSAMLAWVIAAAILIVGAIIYRKIGGGKDDE